MSNQTPDDPLLPVPQETRLTTPPPRAATPAGGSTAQSQPTPRDAFATVYDSASQIKAIFPTIPGYEILGELGRGGMGVVYKARQARADRLVALKLILAGEYADPETLERFRIEGQALARLQHPGVVQIHEIGEHEGRPYFSMEYCAGGSLQQQLNGTPMPPAEAAEMIETLARAVHAAHQAKVIHRDLKPGNVLLAKDGAAKITDFGLAKKLDAVTRTQTGVVMGTPSYMPPEQAQGKSAELSPAADVYSLGALLYECLTGRPPFRAPSVVETILQVISDEPVPPTELQPKAPRDLETICLKCLQKDPNQRYATAEALAEDVARFRRDEPIQARPVGRAERAWRWTKRNPVVAGLLVAVLLTFAAGAVVGSILFFQARDEARMKSLQKDRADREAESAIANARTAIKNEQTAKDNAKKANSNLQLVREVLDETAVKLSRDPRLLVRGLRSLQRELLETQRRVFEQLIERKGDEPELLSDKSKALFSLAEITNALDEKETALAHLDDAQAALGQLTGQAQTESVANQTSLVLCHVLRGKIHEERGRFDAAQQAYEKGQSICKALDAAHPKNADVQATLAKLHTTLGVLHGKVGRVKEAEAAHQQAVERLEKLVERHPEDGSHRNALAKSLMQLAESQRDVLDHWNAEKADYKAARAAQALVKKFPEKAEYQSTLAEAFGLVRSFTSRHHEPELRSDLRRIPIRTRPQTLQAPLPPEDTGGLPENLFQIATDTARQLVTKHPDVPAYRLLLAKHHRRAARQHFDPLFISMLTYRKGFTKQDPRPATLQNCNRNYQAALEILTRLTMESPSIQEHHEQLATTFHELATFRWQWRAFYAQADRIGDARLATDSEMAFLAAVKIRRRLATDHRGILKYQTQLAESLQGLSYLFGNVGRLKEALTVGELAAWRRRDVVERFPGAADHDLELAKSQEHLGNVHAKAERWSDAKKAYEQANRRLARLVESPQIKADLADTKQTHTRQLFARYQYHLRLAISHELLANSYFELGKWKEAEIAYRSALEVWHQIAPPGEKSSYFDQDVQVRSAYLHRNLGDTCRRTNNLAQAEHEYRTARTFWEKVIQSRQKPEHSDVELGRCLTSLASVLVRQNRVAEAESIFQRAAPLFRPLNGSPIARYVQLPAKNSGGWETSGLQLHWTYDVRALYELAIRLQQNRLAKKNDSPGQWLALVDRQLELGALLKNVDHLDEAEKLYQSMANARDKLTASVPQLLKKKSDDVLSLQHRWTEIEHRLGKLHASRGQAQLAETELKREVKDLEALLVKAKGTLREPELEHALARAYHELGEAYAKARRIPDAASAYQKAIDVNKRLVAQFPKHVKAPQFSAELARSHYRLGELHRRARQWTKAEASANAALQLRQKLVKSHPKSVTHHEDLADSYQQLARTHNAQRKTAAAINAYNSALSAAQSGIGLETAYRIAEQQYELGRLYLLTGNVAKAQSNLALAAGTLENVIKFGPRYRKAAVLLRSAHVSLGEAAINLGQKDKSALSSDRAVELSLTLDGKVPANLQKYLSDDVNALVADARSALASGDYRKAEEHAKTLTLLSKGTTKAAYSAAQLFSSCIAAVAADASYSEGARMLYESRCARRAVAALRKAQAAGYFASPSIVKQLSMDPELASIRDKEGFRELRRELTESKRDPKP